ncbi:MAG: hypothetical protein IIW46_03865 [Bacteroidaceae bacterium]|nr:hypothetical protein [Bacteroidaceae bacterium]
MSELIVMLTYDDLTVRNAAEIFDKCKHSKAKFWGFKQAPLPIEEMRKLCAQMKSCGKTTFLEVVAYTEEEGISAAKVAHEAGFDVLMGTIYSDSIRDYCNSHHLKYMPFVGDVSGRPSVLKGEINDIIAEARVYESKGVFGIDLLGYRYVGDAVSLNKKLVEYINLPVCIAGSIDSFEKLDEVKNALPWAFTIGSAFFDEKFGSDFAEQIDRVYDYMNSDS